MQKAWLVALLAITAACRSMPPKPVDIESYDMCAWCRMAISQKQFASEIIEASGSVLKFDDIGCMLRYRKRQPGTPAATFVVDYQTRQWLNAPSAFFLHSAKLQTPMGGGFVAFGDSRAAASTASEFDSSVLRFSQIEAAEEGGE